MNFPSMEQRIIHTYLDTFPDFYPNPSADITDQAQRQFYDFMLHAYETLAERPSLLFSQTHEDGAHTNRFNKGADRKPEMSNQLRRSLAKMEDLLGALYRIGETGRLVGHRLLTGIGTKINRNHLTLLAELGITCAKEGGEMSLSHGQMDELMLAWNWMATRPGASVLAFSRCLFDPEHSYASGIYGRLLNNQEAYRKLISYLKANGYARIDNRDNQIALDYVKNYDPKDQQVKDAWAERSHGGISLKYDPIVKQPAYLSLRVPKPKVILSRFDDMGEDLRSFVVASNKQCDGCRYCVQTDKTGKRGCSSVIVSHHGREYELCLLFPGFSYSWPQLDENLANGMMQYLTFIDETLGA